MKTQWRFFVLLMVASLLGIIVTLLSLDRTPTLWIAKSFLASSNAFNAFVAPDNMGFVENELFDYNTWKAAFLNENDSMGIEMLKTLLDRGSEQSYPKFSQDQSFLHNKVERKNIRTKVILLWTTLFGQHDWLLGFLGSEPFVKMNCPVSNCFLTYDREHVAEADAVLIHFRDDFDYRDQPSNSERKANQHWIFVLWESPEHTYDGQWWRNRDFYYMMNYFNKFFNWTMTYRLDSDIPFNYGKFKLLENPDFSRVSFNRLAKKTKTAVWMNSHCATPSNREAYIAALNNYTDVDVIGDGCGVLFNNTKISNGICKRLTHFNGTTNECLEFLAENYKFYLAFENSLCRDYVTEKLYRAAKMDLIPVVYNGANMSLFAPKHSYIDAKTFSSPEALAIYLEKVGSDPVLYNSYFWWKPFYDVEFQLFDDSRGFVGHHFCDLCAKVNYAHSSLSNHKIYNDIGHWWTTQGHCVDGYYKRVYPAERKRKTVTYIRLGDFLVKTIPMPLRSFHL